MTTQTDKPKSKSTSPWFYVPSLYFAEGMPYTVVNIIFGIAAKNLGVSNSEITKWTNIVALPWVIKMFWSPIVDTYLTKRKWMIITQFIMFCLLGLLAFSFQLNNFFFISIIILAVIATVSATFDIATDGYYMQALNPDQQAKFVGIRSLAYRLAILFGLGILVVLAGKLTQNFDISISLSWTISIGILAVLSAVLFIFHSLFLPVPNTESEYNQASRPNNAAFVEVVRSFFSKRRIAAIIAFILLYRLGEAMLEAVAKLFVIDALEASELARIQAQGGVIASEAEKLATAFATEQVGFIFGTFGLIGVSLGGILGGFLISKYGLKKCLLPMALVLNIPNLFYVYMASVKPQLELFYTLITIEQFGYGLGFTAFTVYLMYICKGEYKTSHFAISTGLMALGMKLPGAVSGTIQTALGYQLFFVLVVLLAIPGILTIFLIPIDEEVESQTT
jgi:PAT family beta-lactamase induction signal transducer AmpG